MGLAPRLSYKQKRQNQFLFKKKIKERFFGLFKPKKKKKLFKK